MQKKYLEDGDTQLFADISLTEAGATGVTLLISDLTPVLEHKECRLYVSVGDCCFNAIAIEMQGCSVDSTGKGFDHDAEELFTVIAYHDGIRHLQFDRESSSPGYIYYANSVFMAKAFDYISKLEKEVCRRCDQNED